MPPNEKIFANHWLYTWIDEKGIKTPGDFVRAIRKRNSFDRLGELSEDAYSKPLDVLGYAENSAVAGRQLDLSGFLACTDFECLEPIVNNLFGRLWHYFDSIVLEEISLEDIISSSRDAEEELLQRAKLLLHLRNIGAEKHVLFTHKITGLCSHHFREYAKEQNLGIDAIFDKDAERAFVQKISAEGRFLISAHDEGWHYEVRHPDIGMITSTYSHSDMRRRPKNKQVAEDVFGAYCCGLIRDVSASRSLGLPLVQAAENGWGLGGAQGDKLDERTVALRLRLPVFRNAPIAEVLKFRNENRASFEVFRAALRQAIREQIKRLNESGNTDPITVEQVANAVRAEYIDPELARIEVQLGGASKGFMRKLKDNATVVGAVVMVGHMTHVPVLDITFAAAAASVADIINKRVDDKQEIANSDLQFLWKARTKSSRH